MQPSQPEFDPSSLLPQRQTHPVTCIRTGLVVATVIVERIAGHVPYLSQWQHTQALHPLFSLSPTELLNFSRNLWNNFCALPQEMMADEKLTGKQETTLRICALAMLHHLSEVEQKTPWIPSLAEVSTQWHNLVALSYWKNYLDSQRFHFPALRITKNNNYIDLASYVRDCFEVKREYETKVRENIERERLDAAEAALRVLRSDMLTKVPKSKKLLWRWFLANIPSKYSRDTEGWMWDLFDAETEEEISEFTLADIDLFEEIVLSEIELGSSVSHAFLERLAYKRKMLESRVATFEIIIPNSITEQVALGQIKEEEPKIGDFPSKVKFMVAHAKWRLAFGSSKTHTTAEINRQQQVSVRATHQPTDVGTYLANRAAEDRSKLAGIPAEEEGEIEDVPFREFARSLGVSDNLDEGEE